MKLPSPSAGNQEGYGSKAINVLPHFTEYQLNKFMDQIGTKKEWDEDSSSNSGSEKKKTLLKQIKKDRNTH